MGFIVLLSKVKIRLSFRVVVVMAAALLLGLGALQLNNRIVLAETPCPCHIFTSSDTQAVVGQAAATDGVAIEVGMRFKADIDGYITGVRFYKGSGMDGETHVGNLWGPDHSLLASATFTNETATGWQDVTFATPVAVTAGSIYTASMYTSQGHFMLSSTYFNGGSDKANYPLTALSSTNALNAGFVGNGVFHESGGSVYPDTTSNSANYWVDATFAQTIDGSAPQVTSTLPANGAADALTGATLTATLDQVLDTTTVSDSTVALLDENNQAIAKTASYDAATKTIRITPSAPLAEQATYTVALRGGNGGVANLDGTSLAGDYQWSFTTGQGSCPCSVWNESAIPGSPTTGIESSGTTLTLGVKVHADESGYLQAVRFYKSLRSTATSHTVHVYTAGGTLLASGTSSGESAQGWQEVPLDSSVPITQGTTYVIAYYVPDGIYPYSDSVLDTQAGGGPFHAEASGSSFVYYSDSFPNQTSSTVGRKSYGIDAVFTTTSAYTEPFTVGVAQPRAGAYGVNPADAVTLTMSNPVDPATVSGSVVLKDKNNATVSGAVSYEARTHTLSFTPSQPLAANAQYTLTLTSSLKDIYGTAATTYTDTFTTGAALNSSLNQGLGGPVLVLSSSSYPYDTYLAEMLRSEGINYFTVKDISQLSSTLLSRYRMVLLARSALSAGQVSTLSSWVNAGGNLVAFHPDKQLAGLLGLTDRNQSLSDAYLKVDTTQNPGKGITAETMQYHTSADIYDTTSGTRTVATLYDDATTPRTNPAVTERAVGEGHAAAFVYDLPKSIALLHQGNPAWAGQNQDTDGGLRPNDLFVGGGSPDWLNTAKAAIPQADEQQRLLTNMLLTMDQSSMPLPRFWILPHGLKGAVIMTEDDHGTTDGTFASFDQAMNYSAKNCSVQDWECARFGSLLYTSGGLTAAQADLSRVFGFAMGVHVNIGCGTSYSNVDTQYTGQLASFRAKYTTLSPQLMDRSHCYAWPGWDTIAKEDAATGMRLNFNYEWYPPSWTNGHAGYLTGSGMAMRFTDASGGLIDVYQGVTDLDYETDATTVSMTADMDGITGTDEFYGVLGTHYDYSDGGGYRTSLIHAAQAHSLPLLTGDQLVRWKDALGSSSFADVTSSSTRLDFTVNVAEGGEGMQAMVPLSAGAGALRSLSRSGTAVSYATNTVKGVQYAIFDAAPGDYQASYGDAATPPAPSSPGSDSSGSSGTSTAPHGAPAAGTVNPALATTASARPAYANVVHASPFSDEATRPQPKEGADTSVPADHQDSSGKSSTEPRQKPAGLSGWKLVGYVAAGLVTLLVVWAGAGLFLNRAPKA